MKLHSIFPTPVAFFKLGREFTAEEMDFCVSQEKTKNEGNETSRDSYVLNHESMSFIKAFIDSSVNEYVSEVYAPNTDVSLRVTQSWLNYTSPGQWHHKHAHPNSFISGVLYMKAVKNRIFFFKNDYQQIKLTTEKFNIFNSDSWWFDADMGDLIVFPSSTHHMVQTMEGEETRISMAFNTFPVGVVGSDDNLTGLKL